MAYFGKIEYYATGEGIRVYYILSSVKDKDAFITQCIESGIDNYFIQGGEFHEVTEIPEKDLLFVKNNLPKMYKVIEEKIYEKGWIWIKYEDYMNFS